MPDSVKNTTGASGDKRPRMPLSMARAGEEVEFVDVLGGMELRRRLAEMGLGAGSRLTVETCGRPGPFVVSVKGSRLILGHGMVQRVFVRPCNGSPSENATS